MLRIMLTVWYKLSEMQKLMIVGTAIFILYGIAGTNDFNNLGV